MTNLPFGLSNYCWLFDCRCGEEAVQDPKRKYRIRRLTRPRSIMFASMIRENRRLVTDEPVEFENNNRSKFKTVGGKSPIILKEFIEYRMCMAISGEYKSVCEVPKCMINTRPHCPELMKSTCYTHIQSCNIESCIATIAIQLPEIDWNIVVTA